MKKLLALLLALTMLVGIFAACDQKCTEHTDANTDGVCDSCGEEVPIPCAKHVDEDINNVCDTCGATLTNDLTKALGLKLMKAVKGQVEAAQSMKLTFEYGYKTKVNIDEENPNGMNYAELKTVYTVWVTKTEAGANAKVHALTHERLSADDEFTVSQDCTILYLVDDVLYTYIEDEDAYAVTDMTDEFTTVWEELPKMIAKLSTDYALSDSELEEMGAAFVTAFNIANNKGSLTLDAKPIFDAAKAKILSYDAETLTIRMLLDDVLALVAPELNCAAIMTQFERIAALTVEEAMTELDAWLTEEYDTTIQGIYDTVLANEQVKELLKMLVLDVSADGEITPEMSEQFEEMYAAWQAMKVADLIPAEMKSVTLYDLIFTSFMPWEEGDANDPDSVPEQSYIPLETTIEQINELLDATAADLEELFGVDLTEMIGRIQMLAEGIEVNALNAKIEMDFDALYQLESLSIVGTLDWECGFFGAYEEEPDNTPDEIAPLSADAEEELTMDDHIVVTVAFTVSELSAEGLTITAPTNIIELL